MLETAQDQVEAAVAASAETAQALGEAEKSANISRKRKFWLV